jgi:hypothetical protein
MVEPFLDQRGRSRVEPNDHRFHQNPVSLAVLQGSLLEGRYDLFYHPLPSRGC